MSKLKWIMKQYWRVGTVRALASLVLGMLVLGRYYYIYIPVLSDMEWIGAVTLGIVLIFIFLGIGWLYDQKARMWSQKTQVAVERDPYYYVPNFKNLAIDYPIIYTLIGTIKGVMNRSGLGSKSIDDLAEYMGQFFRSAPNKKDLLESQNRAERYIQGYPFKPTRDEDTSRIPLRNRIKLAWEVQILRVTWIQQLTGLLQDVLIFGAIYVVVVFPGIPPEQELLLAVLAISLPMLIVLTIFGWYYDKKLKAWSADIAVKIERNPYSYVAEPYLYSRIIPFFYAFLKVLRDALRVRGAEYREVEEIISYLSKYSNLSVSRTQDLQGAQDLRKTLGVLFQENENRS